MEEFNMVEKNFGYINNTFQLSLVKVMIEDKKFCDSIMDIMDPKYFDNIYFKYIVSIIKEFHSLYDKIPDYEAISQQIMSERSSQGDTTSKIHMDTLKSIQEHECSNEQWVKDTAMNFCKQQNLKRELKVAEKIIENGDFENYNEIEKIIQKALQIGTTNSVSRNVFFDIEGALEKDSRVPIPTGVVGLDNLLRGGLGIGELGVILAPTGIGKSTLATIFANSAFNVGHNVLQIFFEDNENAILRKHYTIWSGVPSHEQPNQKDLVIPLVKERQHGKKNELRLLKLPGADVTVSQIRSYIRKEISGGFNPDLVIIDYVDCISPEKAVYGEEWKGEGNIMRHLESMTSEFNVAMWVATQGNRDSMSSEIVMADQMGGSIKKAQIGHVILSIGKTLEQKENKLATITLLKSRIGDDGVIFQNCKFDNEYLVVDIDTQTTLLGHKQDKETKNMNRIAEIYKLSEEKRIREEKALEEKKEKEKLKQEEIAKKKRSAEIYKESLKKAMEDKENNKQ